VLEISLAGLLFLPPKQSILMGEKRLVHRKKLRNVPVDEAEFRKPLGKAKEKLKGFRNGIRRRKNRNPLWEI